jgi:hypothetical protein
MPWGSKSIIEVRREFVRLALSSNSNIRGLCRRFGISPKTAYQTLNDTVRKQTPVSGIGRGSPITLQRDVPILPRWRSSRCGMSIPRGAAERSQHSCEF